MDLLVFRHFRYVQDNQLTPMFVRIQPVHYVLVIKSITLSNIYRLLFLDRCLLINTCRILCPRCAPLRTLSSSTRASSSLEGSLVLLEVLPVLLKPQDHHHNQECRDTYNEDSLHLRIIGNVLHYTARMCSSRLLVFSLSSLYLSAGKCRRATDLMGNTRKGST